jgi:hypothetical protein
VTPDSIIGPISQDIGPVVLEYYAQGQSVFSADGTRYAASNIQSPLMIMNFDRCTGMFSNPISISIPVEAVTYNTFHDSTGGGANGLSFSPNGQYLYENSLYYIDQYDLADTNMNTRRSRIYEYSYPADNVLSKFSQEMLLPNNKILVSNYQGNHEYYHVIDSPDNKGIACNFKKDVIKLPNYNCFTISNMPHYKLGVVSGSSCDTINTGVESVRTDRSYINVYPNPVSHKITIQPSTYLSNMQITVCDIVGKEVYKNENVHVNEYIDVHDLSPGIYQIKIVANHQNFFGKFEKE